MADYDQSFQFENEASASSKPLNLKLIFPNEVASPVYTGTKITGKPTAGDGGNECMTVMLVDSDQPHQPLTTGSASSATVNIVLLPATFGGSTTTHGSVWTPQHFQNNIIINWGKKKNLLLGNLTVVLKDGVGIVGEIRIKHDGKPLKNDRFRLGAMVVGCFHEVKEAITAPFDVKDRRNESKDSRQLLPTDKLWRLKNIGKRGPIVRCLESEGVLTVSDFNNMHDSDPRGLQEICRLYGKRWDTMVHHAKRGRIENEVDGNGSVGSTTQLSNNTAFFNSDGYVPQPYHQNDISVQDYEVCGLVLRDEELEFNPFQEDGIDGATIRVSNGGDGKVVLAKKRWMKVRATLWFSLVSCLKVGFGTMGSTLAGYAGSKVGATLAG